jgi:hypothetical protein
MIFRHQRPSLAWPFLFVDAVRDGAGSRRFAAPALAAGCYHEEKAT